MFSIAYIIARSGDGETRLLSAAVCPCMLAIIVIFDEENSGVNACPAPLQTFSKTARDLLASTKQTPTPHHVATHSNDIDRTPNIVDNFTVV